VLARSDGRLGPGLTRSDVDCVARSAAQTVAAAAARASGTPSPDTSPTGPDEPPSIFAALPEQLGLKLESSRAPVEVLVIDHIERPSDN
jgi:uncharacterized protein (TIGR03435 family)